MKKILLFIVLLISLFLITSCEKEPKFTLVVNTYEPAHQIIMESIFYHSDAETQKALNADDVVLSSPTYYDGDNGEIVFTFKIKNYKSFIDSNKTLHGMLFSIGDYNSVDKKSYYTDIEVDLDDLKIVENDLYCTIMYDCPESFKNKNYLNVLIYMKDDESDSDVYNDYVLLRLVTMHVISQSNEKLDIYHDYSSDGQDIEELLNDLYAGKSDK